MCIVFYHQNGFIFVFEQSCIGVIRAENFLIRILILMTPLPPSISCIWASEPASFLGRHIVRSKPYQRQCRSLNPLLPSHIRITYTPMTVDNWPGCPVSLKSGSKLLAACFHYYQILWGGLSGPKDGQPFWILWEMPDRPVRACLCRSFGLSCWIRPQCFTHRDTNHTTTFRVSSTRTSVN